MSAIVTPAPRFDGVASIYRWLEYATFGRALERARLAWIDQVPDNASVLALGDGDGRATAELLRRRPGCRVRVIDASARMLTLADRRLPPEARSRVTFECADLRRAEFPADTYDAVLTFFSLDCLTEDEVRVLIDRVRPALRPDAAWLWSDFQIPENGWRRRYARVCVRALYWYFGLMTGLQVRALPPVPKLLAQSGFEETARGDARLGVLTARAFRLMPAVLPMCPERTVKKWSG